MVETVLLRDGVIDLVARRVWRVGAVSRLTGTEVEVLWALRQNAGRTVDRQELLVQVMRHPADSLSRAVDVCVHRLRTKLERDPARPVHLVTVQGEGYRLVPATVVEEVRTNVVPARSPMVGRDSLVARIRDALDEGPVALLGPAGVGKSRLAHAIAVDAGQSWAPAGSWWIDLSEGDGSDAVRAVSAVAGVDADTVDGLARVLNARGPSLVVLDTCDRCAEVAGRIARALGPEARVLLTSRAEVPGTIGIEVPPLDPEAAVALLLERAGQTGTMGTLEPALVGRLVEAMDRLPLAIELAAARLSGMPLVRVEQELVRPLRLLRERGGSGRQASVEASIRWSWEGLSAPDRAALVHLSAFRGPIPDDAAGPAVDRLVAAHLVRRVDEGVVPWHAVREFAVSQADPETLREAAVGHAAWVARFSERQVSALWGPGYRDAVEALERREADLVAAGPALAAGDLAVVTLARAELAFERAQYDHVVELIDAALPSIATDDPHRLSLMCVGATSAGRAGDWPDSEIRARTALAEGRTPADRVPAWYALTSALLRMERRDEAIHAATEAVREAGDEPVPRARALGAQVLAEFHRPDVEALLELVQMAVDAALSAGAQRIVPAATSNLAATLVRAHRSVEAEAALRESATHLIRNRRAYGIVRMNLSIFQIARDLPQATEDAEHALEAFRDTGATDAIRAALGLCGLFRAMAGDVVDGLADLDEVHAQLAGMTTRGATLSRSLRAAALAMVGQGDAARTAFEEVRSALGPDLGLTDDDAAALIAAWVDGVPASAETMRRLEESGGDRRWIHAQILRFAGRTTP